MPLAQDGLKEGKKEKERERCAGAGLSVYKRPAAEQLRSDGAERSRK